ncbi:GumC family protein [Desulfovulcanus sp.]
MDQQQADIGQYVQVLKRRKLQFFIPAAIVFVLIASIAFLLPSIYRSTATILIESQEVPPDLIRTTVTGYAEQRLQTLTKIVLSRQNLLKIINQFNLYSDLRDTYTTEELIDKMREDITMQPIQAEVVNPKSGRPATVTIAFTLSYEGKDPQQVLQVTNTLASLFLEENLKSREEKADTTYAFLEKQAEALDKEIHEIEAKLADFKEKHLHSLPELMQLNLQTLQQLQKEIEAKQEQIKTLEDRKIYLQGQLATIEPVKFSVTMDGKRVMTPEEELKSLRSQYLALKAKYSDKHPDVNKLKAQLQALEDEIEVRGRLRESYKELRDKEHQLAQLSQKFSPKYPEIVRLKKEIANLKKEIATLKEQQKVLKVDETEQPENPAYINLETQIKSTEMEIEKTQKILADLRAKYDEYKERIEQTPRVEQEYKSLLRDYESTKAKYKETMLRMMTAKEAKGLEESRMAEKLTLVDPPALPEKPYKPNRLALLLIGFVLSIGAGVGTGAVAEYMDQSIYSVEELSRLTGKPVLSAIPYLETKKDRARKLRRKIFWILGITLAFTLVLWSIHVFYRPLDVLWIQIMRKLQMIFA